MSTQYVPYPAFGTNVAKYANFAAFPATAVNGALAIALDTGSLYEYNSNLPGWQLIGPPVGMGTVTSVGLADPTNTFNITGSPVTTAGTLTIASYKSQAANTVLAAPNGSSGAPTFRLLVAGDIPGGLAYANQALSNLTSPTAVNQPLTGVGGTVNLTTGALVDTAAANQLLWGTTGITLSQLTASLPLQLNASKIITSAAINLSGSQATGTLAAARFPALTGDVTTTAGSLAASLVATTNSTLTTLSALSIPFSQVTGTLGVSQGGTGDTTLTAYAVLAGGTTATGALQQVSGVGTAGQVLTSAGASALPTWSSSAGFNYLSSNTSVYGGTNSTLSFTGARNTLIGVLSAVNLGTGTDNTWLGYEAGQDFTGTGSTIIGSKAAPNLVTGSGVTILGYQADLNGHLASADSSFILIGTSNNPISGSMVNNIVLSVNSGTLNGGGSNIAIGTGVSLGASASNGVAIGTSATINSTNGIAIGKTANAAGINAIAIGPNAAITGARSLGVGADPIDDGAASTIILGTSQLNQSTHTGCFIVGITSAGFNDPTTASNQITFGTATTGGATAVPLSDMFMGRGAVGDGTATNVSIQPSPMVGSNLAGATMTLRGGNSTGTGVGGAILFQTAPAGTTGSTANTLTTVGQITSTGAHTIGATSTTPTHVLNTLSTTGAGTGTLTNVPGGAGNPTGYVQITINGTTAYIPYWT